MKLARHLGIRRPSEVRFLARVAAREVATGVSSRALTLWALGLDDPPQEWDGPMDSGDYGRCVKAYQAAPPHIRKRMKPYMDRYADQLNGQLEPTYDGPYQGRRGWDHAVEYV